MTDDHAATHVAVTRGGRALAWCDIDVASSAREARLNVVVASGHLPMDVRGRLVDLTMQRLRDSRVVTARLTVPRGEAEFIRLFSERCTDVQVRTAGATCLVDAQLLPATPLNACDAGPARLTWHREGC